MTPATAFASPDFITARPSNKHGFSSTHYNAYYQLKNGSSKDRTAAANTLRTAVADYPLNPVLDIWYLAKDLIQQGNSKDMRTAGWLLLTECVKHKSSNDLERKEFFQTLTVPAHPEDFSLQLEAMMQLTNNGRSVSGFDYDLLPLITRWLQSCYEAARTARKAQADKTRSKAAKEEGSEEDTVEESKNLAQLFLFTYDTIKFSFNTFNSTSLDDLIDVLLYICTDTVEEADLRACIKTIEGIVTFGSIPNEKLPACVRVLGSIICVVSSLQKESWATLSHLCKSHNGQATVRILLDTLRDTSTYSAEDAIRNREIRGALAVIQKLLSKTIEKGYPPCAVCSTSRRTIQHPAGNHLDICLLRDSSAAQLHV